MNKNVMCVTVCRNTTNIGFYDVELGNNSIRYLKMNGYQTLNDLTINEIAERIYKLQNQILLDLIIIDCRAMGIAVSDELDNKKCKTPIYKAFINRQMMSESLLNLHNLVKEDSVEVNSEIDIDLSKFRIWNACEGGNANVDIRLGDSKYNDMFSNICFVAGYANSVLSDMFKIDKREKIETNLNEILRILVDDLHDLKYPDAKEIEKLARLIDKVNYIRGQY